MNTDLIPKKNSGSYTIRDMDADQWYSILSQYYFDRTSSESESDDSVNWIENPEKNKRVVIYFIKKSNDINLTVTLFTNGTVMFQGAAHTLDVWNTTHFPVIQKLYRETVCNAQSHCTQEALDQSLERKPTLLKAGLDGTSPQQVSL